MSYTRSNAPSVGYYLAALFGATLVAVVLIGAAFYTAAFNPWCVPTIQMWSNIKW